MLNFFKVTKAKEECYNNIQTELQLLFLQILDLEYRRYRIENCTPEFILFIQNSGFNYRVFDTTLEFLDGDKDKVVVVLKCSKQSFEKRIDFINKDISDFL